MFALLALASSAAWGTSDFFAGLVTKRHPATVVVGWTHALAFAGLTVVVIATGSISDWSGWPVFAVTAGLAGVIGLVCFYTALATGTMGVVAPIAALGVIVPVLLGVASGDAPSPWTWIGMLVAIVGVTLASGPELNGRSAARPLILAGTAAIAFGLALFLINRGAHHSTLMTMWGMRLTSTTLFGAAALRRRTLGGVNRQLVPRLAAIGAGDLLANLLFGLASTRGQLSVAAVLGAMYPVATILLARTILKERLAVIQRVGVVASMIGAALISLTPS